MANNHFKMHEFASREGLVDSLKEKIIDSLANAIEAKGFATLALSGGSTPVKLLQALSLVAFDWEKVRVTLVDERWVEVSSEQSNERLIRDNLLQNAAKGAAFFGLKTDANSAKESLEALEASLEKHFRELDVVVLGMGLDAHTASFFPDAKELEHALGTQELVCVTTASVDPKERITLSRSFLLSSKNLLLHIEGKEKKEVFLRASESDEASSAPIIAMMRQREPLLEVYYAD